MAYFRIVAIQLVRIYFCCFGYTPGGPRQHSSIKNKLYFVSPQILDKFPFLDQKFVSESARLFFQNVLTVVEPEGPAEFVVCHRLLPLMHAPHLSYPVMVDQHKHPLFLVLPDDQSAVLFIRQEKLKKLVQESDW